MGLTRVFGAEVKDGFWLRYIDSVRAGRMGDFGCGW